MTAWTTAICIACSIACAAACDGDAPASTAPSETTEVVPIGDAARGRELFARFECHRCHEGTSLAPPPIERQCVGCHRAIDEGTLDAPDALLARWQSRLHSLPAAPDLRAARRLDPSWIAAYLLEPVDLRPGLLATMPRLALDERDARDLAAALTEGAPTPRSTGLGDPARGARLVAERGCTTCHRGAQAEGASLAVALAPDLSRASARMSPGMLEAWLRDPAAIAPNTLMPATGIGQDDARDIAAHLGTLTPPLPPAIPARLPPVAREVRYDELEASLFRAVCWHCHADPAYAIGDGGPGNTGGLGFAPRGLDVSTLEGLRSGALDEEGARRSVFREIELEGERMPLIVAVLRARQIEEAGGAVPGLRGMPLGLPSVAPDVIAALEAWIAAGRPP